MATEPMDLTALSWCLGEIRESLARAEAALEAHLQTEDDADNARLRAARGWLHQAHGALQVVDLDGVAAVTQEAETLLDRCDRGELRFDARLVGKLSTAFASIVEYLESVASGSGDSPVSLFPQYRELLALRGAERVEPADLYRADLSVRPPRADASDPLDAHGAILVRAEFERGLLRFLRNADDADALASMHRAIERFHRAYSASPHRTFWWLSTAFFDALRAGTLPTDLYAKRLVARINLQIRRTLQQGSPIADRMLRDLLFALARAGDGAPLADEARRLYRLAGTVPVDFEAPRFGTVDARALRAARDAIGQAKGTWEKYVRGSAQDLAGFAQAAQAFDASASRLPWAGLQRLSGALVALRRALAAAGAPLAEVLSLEVATALLFVEQALERGARGVAEHEGRAAEMADRLEQLCQRQESDGSPMPEWLTELSRAAQDRLTTAAFVGELQSNLRACEKALDAFFRDPSQRAELPALDGPLKQVSGALRLLGHEEAAAGADAVARRVAAFAEALDAPEAAECEEVASSLGALGFFVESLRQPERHRGAFDFSRSGDAFVARLGEPALDAAAPEEPDAVPAIVASDARGDVVPFDVSQPIEPAPVDAGAPADEPTVAVGDGAFDEPGVDAITVDTDIGVSLEQLLDERRAKVRPLLASWQADAADTDRRAALRDTLAAVRDEAMLLDDDALRAHAAAAIERIDAGDAPDDAGLVDLLERVAGGAQAAPVLLPAEHEVDDELLGIFLDEADEVLAGIAESRARVAAAPSDVEQLTTLRRGFHTLKGSSRMVGLADFGEAAWAIEQVFNGWLADEKPAGPALLGLVEDAHARMTDWVLRLRVDARAAIDPVPLINRAAALSGDAIAVPAARPAPARAEAPSVPDLPVAAAPSDDPASGEAVDAPDAIEPFAFADPLDGFDAAEVIELAAPPGEASPDPSSMSDDGVLDPLALEPPVLSPLDRIDSVDAGVPVDPVSGDEVSIGGRTISAALYRIFLAEADQLLEALDAVLGAWRADPAALADEAAARAAHSLCGSARVVRLGQVHATADALERFLRGQAGLRRPVGPVDLDDYAFVLDRIRAALHQFAAGDEPRDDPAMAGRADALADRWVEGLPQLPFDDVTTLEALPDGRDAFDLDALIALDGNTEPAFVGSASSAADVTGTGAPGIDALESDSPALDASRVEAAAADASRADPPDVDAPDAAVPLDPPSADVVPLAAVPSSHDGPPVRPVAPLAADLSAVAPRPAEPVRATASEAAHESIASLVDEVDAELVPVFVEEADELMPRIDAALRAWAARPDDASQPEALMRLLHTVKGSARMAGAMRLGQLVHDMETRVEAATALPSVPPALIEDLIARHDQALALYEAIRHPQSEAAQAAARAVVEGYGAPSPEPAADGTDAAPSRAAGETGTAAPAAAAPGSQLIRVRADILDRLVNEAGEVSIARARLDNELGGIRQSLSELTENVNRLRSQLREIELAADSQIQAREQRETDAAQFDPLEFDRYTRFQELTRMLAESVNDVATVQQNALRSLDEATRDLARQSQVTRDLQQDLMRIRMVQFGSVADRLYRVVRQAAKELDKRVHLDLKGAAAELDRGVLERMAGPIEHLLRNSVAHGIEPRAARIAAGKPETGEIVVEVRQEGNEVTMTFSDDGAGLDYARIRARGIERGLVAADAQPTERELGQLIFMPGFSTATQVTTLAGRGVGMDVVRAEVAAMGGRIDLDSTPGRGTRFTVHLPVSLAVAQVVLLTVGEVRVSVAAALIEQVLQLKPEQIAAAYTTHHVDWNGQPLPLYFLGSLLELPGCTPLAQRYSPVVILRSGTQRIALHVDHVSPSQEVVVKHVGPQLARLTGMAGATVLGNGDIVLILNPVTIAATRRGAQAGEGDTASFAPTHIEVAPMVMVVDDSVTVRKVTQRLLAREGYQVTLAKDGVDAMRQLQDVVPDVMLLDIEMPRMDGFDLMRNLRGDERWKRIPVVMISSRTADKHRNHAMSLGVDAFLGKPYDEVELLKHVASLTARRAAAG